MNNDERPFDSVQYEATSLGSLEEHPKVLLKRAAPSLVKTAVKYLYITACTCTSLFNCKV